MEIESPIIFNHLPLSKLQIHLTQKTLGSKTMIKAIKKSVIIYNLNQSPCLGCEWKLLH